MDGPGRELLVAIGDEIPEAALEWATGRALRAGWDLRLVHVVHPPHGLAGPPTVLISFEAAASVGHQLLHGAKERVADHAGRAGERLEVHTDAPTGHVVNVLTELAGASTGMVLQHRRRSRVVQVLAGSVTAHVAARATVPVVSVPEDWTPPQRAGELRPRTTVGVADLATGVDQVAHAVTGAVETGSDVVLLHALDVPAAYELSVVSPDNLAEWSTRALRELEELARPWRAKHPDLDLLVHIGRGRAADVLVDASKGSDLLVVGRGHGHLPLRHHLGSVARAVLRESACPVEVLP